MPEPGANSTTRGPTRGVDLRTALVLSGAYGVSGAIAASLLLPGLAKETGFRLPMPLPAFAAALAVQLTAIYGLLGWAGLRLARRRGLEPAPLLTGWWLGRPAGASWRGLLGPAAAGAVVGLALVAAVAVIARAAPGTLPKMLHPPGFAAALAASTAGAFGEEILFRLFLVSAVLRLLPERARWSPAAAVTAGALAFGLAHTPAMVAMHGGVEAVPAAAWVWVIGLNTLAGLAFGALFLRRGIGGAIAGHWCCNLVWHVGSVLP